MTENTRQQAEMGTRAWFAARYADRHPSVTGVLRHFSWGHLPDSLKPVSAIFGRAAISLVEFAPDGPELVVALRKLVEAKDQGVRAAVDALFGNATVKGSPETEITGEQA